MQEAFAELARAPWWVQVTLSAAALALAAFFIVPGLLRRRHARQFAEIARGLGHALAPGAGSFSTDVDGRRFEVSYQHRSGTAAVGTTRGPYGTLIVTTTELASRRWEMHGVDIARGARLRRAFGHALTRTGDAAFDGAFAVKEDGVPVRQHWLDAPTRQAIAEFYDHPAARGTIWIQQGRLSHLLGTPWTGVDAVSLRGLLGKQAALAAALDQTARPI